MKETMFVEETLNFPRRQEHIPDKIQDNASIHAALS